MFDNILLLAPDNEPIGRLSKKKANWYVSRGLAEELKSKVVRLTFEPAGRSVYCERDLEEKENHCVVCNTKSNLTKHHIVPYCFRKYMPVGFKGKASFDVVAVCETCHSEYHKHTKDYTKQLREAKSLPPLHERFLKLKKIKGLVESLMYEDLIPEDRVLNMKQQINSALKINVDDCDLKELSNNLKISIDEINESKELLDVYDLEEFVILWRKHFIETMDPQFLSQTWLDEIHIVPERG